MSQNLLSFLCHFVLSCCLSVCQCLESGLFQILKTCPNLFKTVIYYIRYTVFTRTARHSNSAANNQHTFSGKPTNKQPKQQTTTQDTISILISVYQGQQHHHLNYKNNNKKKQTSHPIFLLSNILLHNNHINNKSI